MEFADRNLLTVPRVATANNTTTNSSIRGGSSLAGGSSTNASSSAASNASSNSNSSANIEGLASGGAESKEGKESKTPDYKWLPKPAGATADSKASSLSDNARLDSKASGAPPLPAPTTAASPSASNGQVLGVAAVESENVPLKGLDFGPVPEEPAGR